MSAWRYAFGHVGVCISGAATYCDALPFANVNSRVPVDINEFAAHCEMHFCLLTYAYLELRRRGRRCCGGAGGGATHEQVARRVSFATRLNGWCRGTKGAGGGSG